jgi:very-short-patch-repair endonuclease
MERDRQNDLRLQEMGWTVLRFWESQIRSDPAAIARIVVSLLRGETVPALDLDEGQHLGVKRA